MIIGKSKARKSGNRICEDILSVIFDRHSIFASHSFPEITLITLTMVAEAMTMIPAMIKTISA